MMRHARLAQTGFTLIEVLVAILIMSIMAVMAWQGVDGIVHSRETSQAHLEQTLRLNTVIGQWDQDLASVQVSNAVDRSLTCDGSTVRLVRRATGGLQVVVWTLRADPAGATWMRWASTAATTQGELVENWMRSQQLLDNQAGQLRTLDGIAQWQVLFFKGNAWGNCQSAVGAQAGALPDAVRMVLTFAPGSGLAGTLTRDTRISP
ncbi:hypothetical protein BH11PSE8_BH11PSE8_42660 [soil metagenome]